MQTLALHITAIGRLLKLTALSRYATIKLHLLSGDLMSLYNIGLFIKFRREELGISQEALCEEICSVVTLSRIENNRQAPRRKNIRMLLERLGYSDLGVFIAEDAESVEIVRLQNIILSEISLKKDA